MADIKMRGIVRIDDDFDLEKIRTSGQCFRVAHLENGAYRFIARDKVLFIRRICEDSVEYEISCTPEEWATFWRGYFDLDRSYSDIRGRAAGKNAFIDEAMAFGEGLRILRQDPWEMLVTFIISQRKNMPAIAKAVELVSQRFGTPVETDDGVVYAFPTVEQLAAAGEDDLRACSLGYRAPYIAKTARQVASGEIDLVALGECGDEELFERLKRANGVGAKVANCVCLFGYGRTSQVPVDVWIARAIEEECAGEDPFVGFGEDAGVMQQYVFYFMTQRGR